MHNHDSTTVPINDHYDTTTLAGEHASSAEALFYAIGRLLREDHPMSKAQAKRLCRIGATAMMEAAQQFEEQAEILKAAGVSNER